jgi:hypothetical protein
MLWKKIQRVIKMDTIDRTWHYFIDLHYSEDFWYSTIELDVPEEE